MTTKKTATRSPAAKPKDEEIVVEAAEEDPKAAPASSDKVVFVPNQHSSGVTTPSGATFTLSPQMSVKLTRTDADDLAAAGFGSIQGG